MKTKSNRHTLRLAAGVLIFAGLALAGFTLWPRPAAASAGPQLIQPAELVRLLHAPKSRQPVIFQVGFRTLYEQAHIPGSEYLGAASTEPGRQALHKRVQELPRERFIVLYCGCCPWSHCPNVQPAYKELQAMGFRNVKVLYIANNFGADWVDKGYPISQGK